MLYDIYPEANVSDRSSGRMGRANYRQDQKRLVSNASSGQPCSPLTRHSIGTGKNWRFMLYC